MAVGRCKWNGTSVFNPVDTAGVRPRDRVADALRGINTVEPERVSPLLAVCTCLAAGVPSSTAHDYDLVTAVRHVLLARYFRRRKIVRYKSE